MEWLFDPTIWAGLLTLIVLEIVLGIDNLIFISILSDKLPPSQRAKARATGLSLALAMRLVLLASISYIITLTTPIFTIFDHAVSGHDIILILGGLFLLFKGTMELHEKLEGSHFEKNGAVNHAKFWHIIIQIVILDAVFSLDSVITAVGMVKHLPVMMLAVCIAMVLMIIASNRLMNFVSAHPTVVILCLGFLLMIGFSLIVEGLGYHIPKEYLYAAIGFSVLVEGFNQTVMFKHRKIYEKLDPRARVAQRVLGILGAHPVHPSAPHEPQAITPHPDEFDIFKPQERLMIHRVLQLAEQSVQSIMTPRHELYWIDLADRPEVIQQELKECPYSCLIVAEDGKIEEPIGIVHKKDLANLFLDGKSHDDLRHIIRQPLIIAETLTVLQAMDLFQKSRIHIAFVMDEYGTLEGLITMTDVAEAIAGDMPEAHENDDFSFQILEDGGVLVNGALTIQELREALGPLILPEGDYVTAAGIALTLLKKLPRKGESFTIPDWHVVVDAMEGRRVSRLKFSRVS